MLDHIGSHSHCDNIVAGFLVLIAIRDRHLRNWKRSPEQCLLNHRISISGRHSNVMVVESADFSEFDNLPAGSGWIVGYINMRDSTTVVAENDEHKKDSEAGCWNRKEVE